MFIRLFLAIAALCCPVYAVSGPVVLTTLDDTLTLEGELLSYDGEFFRVSTAFGELTLDGGNLRCSGAGCPDPDQMVARASVAGPADMVHRLMPALLELFAELRGYRYDRLFLDDATISWHLRDVESDRLVAVLQGVVSSDEEVLTKLAAREIDIALGRQEAGGKARQDVIALDALVPIVAAENTRAMVTHTQLVGLFGGRIARWSKLGGPDLPVTLHLPNRQSAETDRLFPSGRFAESVRHEDPHTLADAVAADPAALGLVPYSAIGNAVPLVVSGACGLATPATRDSIQSEDYPLTQPMFLQRIGSRQPRLVRDFIAFARGHEAQAVIRAAGFVDQAIGRIGFERQGDRIANAVMAAGEDPKTMAQVRAMIGSLMRAERLSLSFRFRDGSSELDPQSASNVLRLADAIGRGEFDARELVFVGFSDGVGPEDGNMRLSQRRASSVRSAVAARVIGEPVKLTVEAFGEAMPMACDDTPWGRQVNRRVEVWLR